MFHLHETQSRKICRTFFLACCLAPTCAVAAWAMLVHLQPYRTWHERALGERLGLAVSIARVSSPRPGAILYQGVELKHPETRQWLGRVRLVEAWREDGAWMVHASQPELSEACLAALWDSLASELRNPSPGAAPLRIEAAEASLELAGGTQSLIDLRVQIEPSTSGRQAKLLFRIAGVKMPRPAELTISRNRQTNPPATRVELKTGESALPCSLLVPAWPAIARLGPNASLCGSFWATDAAGGWQGEVAGEIRGIELATLINDQFPHHLSGRATLSLAGVSFAQGRLDEAAGSLSAGPGVVSRSLLAAAEETMRFVKVSEPKTASQLLCYEELGLSFSIDERGLVVRGRCQNTAAGAVLTDSAGALVGEPSVQVQPVINLVRTLVPQSEVLVPASQETHQLTQVLPIPAVMLPRGTLPEARKIRVGDPIKK